MFGFERHFQERLPDFMFGRRHVSKNYCMFLLHTFKTWPADIVSDFLSMHWRIITLSNIIRDAVIINNSTKTGKALCDHVSILNFLKMSDLFLFLCASRPLFLRIDYFILKTVIVAFLKMLTRCNSSAFVEKVWKFLCGYSCVLKSYK